MKNLKILIVALIVLSFFVSLATDGFIKAWTFGQGSLLVCALLIGLLIGLIAITPYKKQIGELKKTIKKQNLDIKIFCEHD